MDKKLTTGIQVFLGFLLGGALNIVIVWAGFPLSAVLPHTSESADVWAYALFFIGAAQLIWQLPVILLLWRKGHKPLAMGVILAASITALLNATCWGLLESGKIKIGG